MPLPDFTMFENRLRKNWKHLQKWARREAISCYRVYDADMPEFPLAADLYGSWLHVSEYQRRHSLTPEEHVLWLEGSTEALARVFELPPEQIFVKTRQRQKGTQQYEKTADIRHEIVVQEGGLQFLVNLSDYLDTGLFLDHRHARALVRDWAAGKRVLNLFAYTGSFTVYAAAGGAVSTTTADLSNTYLAWAQRNLGLNGLSGPQHAFVRADVLQWLDQSPTTLYDLIILDPPTFSNSKMMKDVLDTQRDHPKLINGCLNQLAPGGCLFFSTNYRNFRLEKEQLNSPDILDITSKTIPPDFRNKKIHASYLIKKQA
jgi:23S rRNA (cytosine1962-C5)-methyltransferase